MAHATSANEICRMEAVQLAGEIRAGNLSAVEVVDAVLARMDRLEPVLHAFCTPTPEAAREDAERIDAELKAGRDPGPLAGVPVGIKDLVATKGVRTAMGSWAYAEFVPDEDDVVVERLKAAGAIVIGKPTCPSSATAASGTTRCSRRRSTRGTPS